MIFTVSTEQAGERLDRFLTEHWDRAESRSEVQRLIRAGNVQVNRLVVSRSSFKLDAGQVVQVDEPAPELSGPASGPAPVDFDLNVVYEDRDIAVIDKPVGMTVHPGAGHDSDTLVNAAVARWPRIVEVGDADRPGIVHRLDRDTSGLLVVALNDGAYSRLSEMVREREIARIYMALVFGHPETAVGVVDAPIGRDPHNRTRQAVVEDGRPSRTHYKVVREFDNFSLLEVRLESGRTHQIRVHLNAISHPVVGDQTYGKRRVAGDSAVGRLNRQFLHASKLEFDHPVLGNPISVVSELPEDLQTVIEELAPPAAG